MCSGCVRVVWPLRGHAAPLFESVSGCGATSWVFGTSLEIVWGLGAISGEYGGHSKRVRGLGQFLAYTAQLFAKVLGVGVIIRECLKIWGCVGGVQRHALRRSRDLGSAYRGYAAEVFANISELGAMSKVFGAKLFECLRPCGYFGVCGTTVLGVAALSRVCGPTAHICFGIWGVSRPFFWDRLGVGGQCGVVRHVCGAILREGRGV